MKSPSPGWTYVKGKDLTGTEWRIKIDNWKQKGTLDELKICCELSEKKGFSLGKDKTSA